MIGDNFPVFPPHEDGWNPAGDLYLNAPLPSPLYPEDLELEGELEDDETDEDRYERCLKDGICVLCEEAEAELGSEICRECNKEREYDRE